MRHQHHSPGGTRIVAVAIMIGHDQASGAGPHRHLDEAVEGTAQLHQARAFFLERFPIGRNHLVEKEPLRLKELVHVLFEKVGQLLRNMLWNTSQIVFSLNSGCLVRLA